MYFFLKIILFFFLFCSKGLSSDISPTRIIVPFPPGGHTDFISRKIANHMEQIYKNNVIVDNRPGGNGAIAAEIASYPRYRANTILITGTGQFSAPKIFPNSFEKNFYKDLIPVTFIVDSPLILVVNSNTKITNYSNFIDRMKYQKNINYATTGNKTITDMAGKIFRTIYNIRMENVSFRGTGPVITQLLSSEKDFFFSIITISSVLPHIKSGQMRGIVLMNKNRMSIIPDIPSINELNRNEDLLFNSKQVVLVNNKASQKTIESLNKVIRTIIHKPEIEKELLSMGFSVYSASPLDTKKMIDEDIILWKRLVSKYNL